MKSAIGINIKILTFSGYVTGEFVRYPYRVGSLFSKKCVTSHLTDNLMFIHCRGRDKILCGHMLIIDVDAMQSSYGDFDGCKCVSLATMIQSCPTASTSVKMAGALSHEIIKGDPGHGSDLMLCHARCLIESLV